MFFNSMVIAAALIASMGLNSVVAWVPSIEAQEQGSTLYVNLGATGNNDGSSWTDAYTDLQDALANAEVDDEIWVAEGTYTPTTGTDRTATFRLPSGVAIYGGFPAVGGTWEDRDWETNFTILSGEIGTEGITTDNSYHVVTANGVGVTTILNGFFISFGCAIGDASNYYGGGMFNTSSSPTLKNVAFILNLAGSGGGMYNTSSSPSLENVTFSKNTALDSGGGMYNNSFSNPTLTNVTFYDNSAQYGGGMGNTASSPLLTNVTFSLNEGGRGGGMHNKMSDPTLMDVTFSENSANNSGGGMYNDTSNSPTLTDVTFSNNSASNNGGGMFNTSSGPILRNVIFSENSAIFYAGGMHNASSSPTLADVTFSDNVAQYGGGMYNTTSSPTLTNITFSKNFATFYGGGMYNKLSSNPMLSNVTFSDNSADYGGGMYNTSSSPMLMNVTFINNSADNGGGIHNRDDSNPTLINAILWGNLNGQIVNNHITPGSATIKYSAIQGGCPAGSDCNNILNVNPLLGDLANNGGFTLTHALPADSPAIDAGDPNNCPTEDQRGVTRPIDGDGDKVAICDMGSYEFDRFTVTLNVSPAERGLVEITPEQEFYNYGDAVTLTATANDDFTFTNWSGDASGTTNPVTVIISGYTSVIANFTQEIYFPLFLR